MPQEHPLLVTCGTNPPIEVPPHVYRLLQQLPDAVAAAADSSNAPLVPLNFSGRNAQDEFLTLITDIICRHRQSIEDFFAVRENLEKSEVLRSKLKGSISDFLENKMPKLEKENEELRKENATLHSELDAARKVTNIQHQLSPPVVNQEEKK
ncbi:hypothetical protein CAEBREN_24177 [Caenorhabditis brenneri]|uniref:Uncharacterized protein n=1 Tax=Caenorhabditis brenneri TaxID=135651 RepID=G0MMQ2_CAEBE|nr:hypothetical protein CAEBREN_24177 [Caenorhabditis brenneri]